MFDLTCYEDDKLALPWETTGHFVDAKSWSDFRQETDYDFSLAGYAGFIQEQEERYCQQW